MNKHYICMGGCEAVSETPGICQDVNCANHGHQFVECGCVDGKHNDFKGCINCGKICDGGCEVESFKEELIN